MATQIINMAAPIKNIVMEQGASVTIPLTVKVSGVAVDLTGYIIRAQVRSSLSDTKVRINMTQQNGKLAFVNAALGTFAMVLLPSDTATAGNPNVVFAKDEDVLSWVYDLELETPSGVVYKGMKGSFTINREATRV